MLAFFRSRMKSITWFIVWFIVITFGLSLLGSGAMLFFTGNGSGRTPAARAQTPEPTEVPVVQEDPLLTSAKKLAEIHLEGETQIITEGEVEKRIRQTELGRNGKLPPESRKTGVLLYAPPRVGTRVAKGSRL